MLANDDPGSVEAKTRALLTLRDSMLANDVPGSLEAKTRALLGLVLPHELVEGYVVLDVNQLSRRGLLAPGCRYHDLPFRVDGDLRVRIVVPDDDSVIVVQALDVSPPVSQKVTLSYSGCNFGGSRPWFHCPEERCGRRVGKLYLDRRFMCRHCVGLTYRSQRMNAPERALERSKRLRVAAGGLPIIGGDFPERPLHMHRQTYDRLKDEAAQAELEFARYELKKLDRILAPGRPGGRVNADRADWTKATVRENPRNQ